MLGLDKPRAGVGARRGRILVADDDDLIRRLFRNVLLADGHEVLLAEDGQQALEKARADRPDVLLLDVQMPRLSGLEVCRQLKADPVTAPMPILLITGQASREERIAGVAAGADDFLTKPVDHEEMVLRVRNAAYRKHLYDELAEKYAELKAMAELHASLTSLIDADTEALAAQLSPQTHAQRTVPDGLGQVPQEGGDHGAH